MPVKPVIFPPYLKKGDCIGIVCPAGYMAAEKVRECARVLTEEWGYRVRLGSTVGAQHHYFSGTDEERCADLQLMLDDDNVKAILCGRGGYGTGRIIDRLDFRAFRRTPKWVIGFSDVTILHAHLLTRYHTASLHAPMANAFNDGGWKNEYVSSLAHALKGKQASYKIAPHAFNVKGKATGILVGGNLSLVAHLIGTPTDVDTRGKILFLEDVGEYLYNVDRMMYQLKRSGKLNQLAGLVLGGFTDCKDTVTPFGKQVDEILHDMVKDADYPVCFHFPVSHEKENLALKVGGTYDLNVSNRSVTLREANAY
jgi:muramoyltetrapeptide carboxypeptidase